MLSDVGRLLRYNARILLASNDWLIIVPVVASQLVVFWHMAIASLVTPATIARSFELVLPLIAAFLCAHVVAPEHREAVDELTLVRPLPFGRIIVLRMVVLYGLVAVLAAMMLLVYQYGLKKPFDAKMVVLAGLPSALFLSLLAMAFASAWRSPVVGIGAALAYWAADAAWGASLNPLFTLHGYAGALTISRGEPPTSPEWMLSKIVLLLLAVVVGLVARAGLGRPASPRRLRAAARVVGGAVPLVVIYLASGAYWQLWRVRGVEATRPNQARLAYQQAFAGFGPIPTPYLFGADFAAYIGYPHQALFQAEKRPAVAARLLQIAQRHPDSQWADNALFEVIKIGRDPDALEQGDASGTRVNLGLCRLFLERYPNSPFAPEVAAHMLSFAIELGDDDARRWAYEKAMTSYPRTHGAYAAADAMQHYYRAHGEIAKAIEAARAGVNAAPVTERPEALLTLGGILAEQGRVAEAREVFTQVEPAVKAELAYLGLDALDLQTGDASLMADRRKVLEARDEARRALQALDAGAAGGTGGSW